MLKEEVALRERELREARGEVLRVQTRLADVENALQREEKKRAEIEAQFAEARDAWAAWGPSRPAGALAASGRGGPVGSQVYPLSRTPRSSRKVRGYE